MRLSRSIAVAVAVAVTISVVASLMFSGVAIAHDGDHPGTYIPSPEGSSPNMHLVASAPRTGSITGYRNSDLAFWGKRAYAGNYEGFRVIDISEPESPVVLSDFPCLGSQNDVSVWQNLLFVSVDTPLTGPECGNTPVAGTGWEGIRIFDVANPTQPRYVGAVATDCGSHTHTLLPDAANGRVLLYVSSYPSSHLGSTPYGTTCARLNPDGTQGHSHISVVSVPLAAPETAHVVSKPAFEIVDRLGIPGYRGCHDISVFTSINRAAAACSSEGQIWDISDPVNPRTIARLHNSNIDFWHSASFTWDGKVVLFGDEAGGGGQPRCRSTDPATLGAMWFYDLDALNNLDATTADPPLGSFKIGRVQDAGNCTTHNFNVIPVQGRYVAVAAYYAGGTSVIDFTDPANAREIGYFDPHGANTWSSYWYNGFVYTNDTGRGFDVMLLSDRVRAGARKLPYLNPQTQE
jgi:hypothetical protein